MSRLLKDLVRPVTITRPGRAAAPPARYGDNVHPGLEALSTDEMQALAVRINTDYLTTRNLGGLPSVDEVMKNLLWYVVALTYDAEANVREQNGEHDEADLLRDVVSYVIAYEDAEIDVVQGAGHLLSTGETFDAVSADLLRTVTGQGLTFSYLDAEGEVRYTRLPKGGFTCLKP